VDEIAAEVGAAGAEAGDAEPAPETGAGAGGGDETTIGSLKE